MYRKTGTGWVLLALFTALCLWLVTSTKFNLGIDLKGGTELRYKLDLSTVIEDPEGVANEVKDIIGRRLDLYGLKEIRIAVEGVDQLVVTLPGGDEDATREIQEQVERAGELKFQLVASGAEHASKHAQYSQEELEYKAKLRAWAEEQRAWNARKAANPALAEPAPVEPKAPLFVVRPLMRKDDSNPDDFAARAEWVKDRDVVLDNRPENTISGRLIESAASTLDPETSSPAVAFSMRGEGATRLGELTGKNIDRQLAIVLDDQVIQAPNIKSRISTNGQITGRYTQKEVVGLVTILKGGSLPSKPALISKNSVGSVFGQDSIHRGLRSVVIGLAVVMVAIALYYLFGGLVANFALAFNTLVVLAFVVCFRQTLTLPGIAGILLTIGMAVDANILIFERVREERKRGKSLMQALTTGYQRAFSVIFDSNLTTVITGIVLLNFGSGPVKGFAVTLIAGILISFVSALFVSKLVISTALNLGWLKQFKMLEAFDTPKIRFSVIQKPFLVVSILVILGTWALVLPRGKANYGIDFTGGARVAVSLSRAVPLPEMRKLVSELASAQPDLFRDWSLQEIIADEPGEEQRNFALLTRARASDESKKSASLFGVGTSIAHAQEPPAEPATPVVTEAASSQEVDDSAQRVRRVLEERLRQGLAPGESSLLLPSAFQEFNWNRTGTTSTLSFLVHIKRQSEERTADQLRELMNTILGRNAILRPKPEAAFDGIRIDSIALVKERSETEPVSQYRVTMSPFTPSLASDVGAAAPSEQRAVTAVRSAFQSDAAKEAFDLSEPFPTVSTVGPVVASNLQGKAIVAFCISILGIIFYVSLRFEFIFGLAAIAALVHDVLITIGVMALTDALFSESMPMKINLPEVAALLTIVGYSINDTIVIFDRIRENLRILGKKKMSFTEIADLSVNQTLSRTLWTSATTLITVCSLLFLGGEAVRGFSFALVIGLIAGTYSTVFIACPILISLQKRSEKRREALATAG